MSMNDAAEDDDYVVKLPSGDARVMSIDELDAALEAGTIHKDSPVLAPGTVTWTTLGVLAGLDELAPPVATAPSSIAPMVLGAHEVDVDLDDDDGASLVPRRRAGKVVGIVFGAVAVLAMGFGIKGAVGQALARRAGEAALAAQPAAPPPAAPVAPPPSALPIAEATPAPPAPAAAPAASAASKATTATMEKADKKKGKLPGAPKAKKK
jgi:hypothetical protein